MIKVLEVTTKKMQKEFIEFPLKLYKGNRYFVPPLYRDELKIFDKDYHYYETSKAIYFNAYKDGKMVGRISGIIQNQANEKNDEKRVRFTRFDSIDDQDVAFSLFRSLEEWAKTNGMNKICGPMGFSDLEREGLLIEGFDQISTFEEQYNYPYYQRLIENEGFVKEVDWFEYKLYPPKEANEKLSRLSKMAIERFNLHIAKSKNTRQLIARYGKEIFECLDKCYEPLYGTVPITKKAKEELIKQFIQIVNVNFVIVICDENEKVVSFGLGFPSIGKAFQKSGGRLTPLALLKLLIILNRPHSIDLGLVAVLPQYQARGVNAIILDILSKKMIDYKLDYCETNLCLEDNIKVQSQWKHFENEIHKKRRSFVKDL